MDEGIERETGTNRHRQTGDRDSQTERQRQAQQVQRQGHYVGEEARPNERGSGVKSKLSVLRKFAINRCSGQRRARARSAFEYVSWTAVLQPND